MAVSAVKAVLPCCVQTVWETVTDFEHYTWRSDLSGTERLNETQFVEYTKGGYATTFTITAAIPCKRWELDVENSNMKGHWAGVFIAQDGQTSLEFTETVTVKKRFIKPFAKLFLKKQQARFMKDLNKRLRQSAAERRG